MTHDHPTTRRAFVFGLSTELKFKILQPEADHPNKKRASGGAEALSQMVSSEWNLLRLRTQRRCVGHLILLGTV